MLYLPQPFRSKANPTHQIEYTQVNPGAPHTLLWCYGAGGRAVEITAFQDFAAKHNELSILCVDRWTLPVAPVAGSISTTPQVARQGPALFTELAQITLELLDDLKIDTFSIMGHSAGAYPMLSLAAHSEQKTPNRVRFLFPLCTHIPVPLTHSALLKWMCTMPDFLFNTVTKIDSLGGTAVGQMVLSVTGSMQKTDPANDDDEAAVYIDMPALKRQIEVYKPTPEQKDATLQRQAIDYPLLYDRVPGVDSALLTDMYRGIDAFTAAEGGGRVVWFTSEKDLFFGPASVRRLLAVVFGAGDGEGDKWKDGRVEMVCVNGAVHADIFRRREVWEEVLRRMVADE